MPTLKPTTLLPDRPRPGAWLPALLLLGAAQATGAPPASPAGAAPPPAGLRIGACAPCVPVDVQRLAALRGGFDDGQGLRASFGLERSVSVNGELVFSQRLQIADLSRVTAAQAQQLQAVLGRAALVQVGVGNSAHLPDGAAGGSLVVQNSLNDQTIRASTLLNVGSNGGQLARSIATHSTLHDALLAPLVAR